MKRIHAAKEVCGLDNKQVAEELGFKSPASSGSAYSEWLSGVRGISCEQAVGLCERVGVRPAWAMFDEGPKSTGELAALGQIRTVIASLLADAQHADAQRQCALPPQTRLEVLEFEKALHLILRGRMDLPPEVWEVLQSASTLVHHLNALPSLNNQSVKHLASGETTPSAVQAVVSVRQE